VVQVFVEVSQRDAVAVGQSVFVRQDTHIFALVLQTRFDGSIPQFTEDKQPTHVDVALSQTLLNGSGVQSAPVTQPTHTFVGEQTGFNGSLQSALFKHSTQRFVGSLQTGFVPLQLPSQGTLVVVVDAVCPPLPPEPPLVFPPELVPPVPPPPPPLPASLFDVHFSKSLQLNDVWQAENTLTTTRLRTRRLTIDRVFMMQPFN
jgi:hypothetical protein